MPSDGRAAAGMPPAQADLGQAADQVGLVVPDPAGCLAQRVNEDSAHSSGEPTADPAPPRVGDHTNANDLRRRRAQINERLNELHLRERALASHAEKGTHPTVAEAKEWADEAVKYAMRSQDHAYRAHQQAGELHDKVAEYHERTAAVLDEHGDPAQARLHRDAAGRDRGKAAEARRRAESDNPRERTRGQ
jgi:hypothetical protein